MLKVSNISFKYKEGNKVLDNVSFDLKEGLVNVLLAPNGAGKTTLIKCICGLEKASEGSIYYNDLDINQMKVKEKSKILSYVPQELSIPYLNVYEVIMLGRVPYINFKETKEDENIVFEIIEKLGLSEFTYREFDTLSGGEKQLVMIARALVQNPKILVLDEPTSNLDISKSIMIMKKIKELTVEHNIITLVSMHDLNLALNYGDNFVLIKDEKILNYGSKDIVTNEAIKELFNIEVNILNDGNNKIINYKEL
ncbi:MAG: ABC transporter ATP-binding protein [Gammaproteobacteria bacterium]|nr:ABC transporter ATP-binding protein [Gammaproteobacteria bacterium]